MSAYQDTFLQKWAFGLKRDNEKKLFVDLKS